MPVRRSGKRMRQGPSGRMEDAGPIPVAAASSSLTGMAVRLVSYVGPLLTAVSAPARLPQNAGRGPSCSADRRRPASRPFRWDPRRRKPQQYRFYWPDPMAARGIPYRAHPTNNKTAKRIISWPTPWGVPPFMPTPLSSHSLPPHSRSSSAAPSFLFRPRIPRPRRPHPSPRPHPALHARPHVPRPHLPTTLNEAGPGSPTPAIAASHGRPRCDSVAKAREQRRARPVGTGGAASQAARSAV